MKQYWLLKSEPETFSLDDLMSRPNKTEPWDGVRNYQARNFLRDDIKKGDMAFFYHSNCKTPSIVGIVEVTKEGYPDKTAFDPKSKYFDPDSSPDNPRWFCVDVQFKKKVEPIALTDLKANPKLKNLALVQKGNRLSVLPVSKAEWESIINMTE